MEKKVAGLLGAVSALAMIAPAHATTAAPVNVEAVMQAGSYADLVRPIPNAVAVLQAVDAAAAEALPLASEGEATVQPVQYYHHHHHHHHHHHRYYHHHHHRRHTVAGAILHDVLR
jgi:hypothetical protein